MSRRKTQPISSPGRVVKHVKVRSPRLAWLKLQRILFGLTKLAVVLGLIGGGLYLSREAIFESISANNDFQLEVIELTTNGHIDEARFLEVCGLEVGQSIFELELSALDRKLTDLPEVASASVFRRWPNKLKVEITEREPIAWIACEALGVMPRDASRGMLLDADGFIFVCDSEAYPQLRDLPVIDFVNATREMIGPGVELRVKVAERAVALLEAHREMTRLRPDYPSIDFVECHTARAYLIGSFMMGTEATFGLYDHDRQLNDLIGLWRHSREKSSFLARANLLGSRNVPIELLPLGEMSTAP